MRPQTALGIDTLCWLFATIAMWMWDQRALAVAIGVFAIFYLYRCVKVMLQITKAQQAQMMQQFDEFEDPRDYH